jgi:hypothetical protein
MIEVKREKICNVTGITRTAVEIATSQDKKTLYHVVILRHVLRRSGIGIAISSSILEKARSGSNP